jgi:hypothetical protein
MPGTEGADEAAYMGAALPYNGTGAEGANPLEFDVNLWYQVSLFPSPRSPSFSIPFLCFSHHLCTPCIPRVTADGVP